MPKKHHIEVESRELTISNVEKVYFPASGFTKGQVIFFYSQIAEVLLPHLVAWCRETLLPDAGDANVKPFADMVYSVAADAAKAILSDQMLEGLDLSGALQKSKCPTLVL
jgi:hypothetical protein